MNLSEEISISFNTKEIVTLDLFFRQCVSKLGTGTFRDEVQAIKDKFDRAVLRSQIAGSDVNNAKPF